MRLVLIRHAESVVSLQGIFAVHKGCLGLTELGIHQTERLAERLRSSGDLADCHILLTSPVPRARQTASILVDALPVKTFIEEVSLSEVNPGEADGMTEQEILKKYGDFFRGAKAPGGESLPEFLDRVQRYLEKLPSKFPDKTVVAVTHFGFIQATLVILFSLHNIDLAPTGITEIHWQDGKWQLVRLDDKAHLEQV